MRLKRIPRKWLFIAGIPCLACLAVVVLSLVAFQVSGAKPFPGHIISSDMPPHVGADVELAVRRVSHKDRIDEPGLTRAARSNFFLGHNIPIADDLLQKELVKNPSNEEAHFFRSITRIFRLLDENQDGTNPSVHTDSLKELFDQFGLSAIGRSIFGLELRGQTDSDGNLVFPPESPTGGDVQEYISSMVIPELDGALSNLSQINCLAFNIALSTQEVTRVTEKQGIPLHQSRYSIGLSPFGPIEVDCGDVRFWQAVLYGLKAGLLTLLAFDLDLDIDALHNSITPINIQEGVINANPACFKLTDDGEELLEQARLAAIAGINSFLGASEFIREYELAAMDPQEDELIAMEPSGAAQEAELRALLGELLIALGGGAIVGGELVNLDPLFSAQVNLREMLPRFAYHATSSPHNEIEPGTFPDPTFKGSLPWMTEERLEKIFN